MSDLCIKIEHLSKSFKVPEGKNTVLQVLKSLTKHQPFRRTLMVLSDLSCEMKKGEKVAVIGRNGCGKTTFLRILAGIYSADSGTVQINAVPRALFRSSIGLNSDISVIDNIYLLGAMHGLERNFLKGKIESILALAEIGHLRFSVLKKLSTGQAQRLALSVFFEADGDLLILDEAMGSVDRDFSQKTDDYFKRLVSSDRTVIMVSHNTATLRKYCTKAMWLEKGVVRMYDEFDKVNAEYERSFS